MLIVHLQAQSNWYGLPSHGIAYPQNQPPHIQRTQQVTPLIPLSSHLAWNNDPSHIPSNIMNFRKTHYPNAANHQNNYQEPDAPAFPRMTVIIFDTQLLILLHQIIFKHKSTTIKSPLIPEILTDDTKLLTGNPHEQTGLRINGRLQQLLAHQPMISLVDSLTLD